jgi:hypothetical protein
VFRRFAHKAKASEVAFLGLDLLILVWAGGVITGEVKIAKGSTFSWHDLLELLLLVLEAMLLLVVTLAGVVLLGVVKLVGGGVELLPLGADGDEVGSVTALEAAPRWSPPLLVELKKGSVLPLQQGNLVIGDALVLLIRSCDQIRQGKLQSRWDSGVGGVSIMATNTSTSNQSFTSKRSIMIWTTFMRQFMRFKLAKQFLSV